MLSDVTTSDVINYDRGDSEFWRWQYRSYCFLGIGQSNKVLYLLSFLNTVFDYVTFELLLM